jgi:drug/metabolite transporter (DMT)-like permease
MLLSIAAILQIFWGIVPSASKLVIEEIPVELYIAIRWSISATIFWLYLLISKKLKPIKVEKVLQASLLGVAGYAISSIGMLKGLKLGGVNNFALMSALGPAITTLMAILILKERPQKLFVLALLLSFLGMVIVVLGKFQISNLAIAGVSALFILFAQVCEALVFVYSKKLKQHIDTIQYLAIAQLSAALFMWGLQLTSFRQFDQIYNLSTMGVYALLFCSVFACTLCYAVLYWLLNHMEGHKLALFDGLHVLSAFLFGYFLFDEKVSSLMLTGGLLLLIGMTLGNLPIGVDLKKMK